ncbi:hypothetical protein EWM63_01700 [Pseudoduganella lutea]|uniref:Uncharacterized protein n=1 Tax=Pseudoduganella lutea TaxID=321985 RepID=A0A4P6KUT6_9BURK|nr:hypothetical protein EWM63_01700 [Pseudoduganella lutea]
MPRAPDTRRAARPWPHRRRRARPGRRPAACPVPARAPLPARRPPPGICAGPSARSASRRPACGRAGS